MNGYLSELRKHYLDQPREVSIETQALCNAACTFCPYPTIDRIGTKMGDELLGRLVDEMAEFDIPFIFSPFKLNEPLLDKRLIPLLQRVNAECKCANIRLFTNGSPLTEKIIAELSAIDRVVHLWVSLNSHDPEEYEAVMKMPFDRKTREYDQDRPTPTGS